MTDLDTLAATLSAGTSLVVSTAVCATALATCYYLRAGFFLPPSGAERFCWFKHGIFWTVAANAINAAFWGLKWWAVIFGYPYVAGVISALGGFFDPIAKGPAVYGHIALLIALGGWGATTVLTLLAREISEDDP
ncbi:MAG: hypothetical protein AAF415_02220 [Pseudomonadota bacterium]